MTAASVVARWSAWGARLQSAPHRRRVHVHTRRHHEALRLPGRDPPNGGTVPLISELGLGAVLETFGGTLLLLGLFTRPVAFLLAGEMAVAYFQFHFPRGFWPVMNGGVATALYCFVWLYFSAAGAGPWRLDAKRGK